jgi:hypothetical protein
MKGATKMRKYLPTCLPTVAALLIFGLVAVPASAYQYKLQRVYISSYQVSGSAGGEFPAGHYDLSIAGEWPDRLTGTLTRGGRAVGDEFDLVAKDCRESRERPRARFEAPTRSRGGVVKLTMTAELDVPGARKRRVCDLQADLPLAGGRPPKHDRPDTGGPGQGTLPAPPTAPGGLTTTPKPPKHDRPDTGGPGQGSLVATALPNLRIRSAKAVAGLKPTDLAVVVVNTGAGAAGKTALKLIYIKDGVATTGSAKVPPLAAGQQTIVTVGAGEPLALADSLNLRVDDPNKISETDEGDNGFIYTN